MCELKKYPFYVTSSCGETAVIRLPDDVFIIARWCMRTGRESAFTIPKCNLAYAKLMQTSGKKACFQFPECSLAYAKLTQGESSSKTGKLCFTRLDTAEPKLSLCKANANERKESLLSISRVQLSLCKSTKNIYPRIVSRTIILPDTHRRNNIPHFYTCHTDRKTA